VTDLNVPTCSPTVLQSYRIRIDGADIVLEFGRCRRRAEDGRTAAESPAPKTVPRMVETLR
jgi:hypothetical protein